MKRTKEVRFYDAGGTSAGMTINMSQPGLNMLVTEDRYNSMKDDNGEKLRSPFGDPRTWNE
jgi:hypothetical protein